jgi:hypothetical protein
MVMHGLANVKNVHIKLQKFQNCLVCNECVTFDPLRMHCMFWKAFYCNIQVHLSVCLAARCIFLMSLTRPWIEVTAICLSCYVTAICLSCYVTEIFLCERHCIVISSVCVFSQFLTHIGSFVDHDTHTHARVNKQHNGQLHESVT